MDRQQAFLTKVRSALGISETDDRRFAPLFDSDDSVQQEAIISKVATRFLQQRKNLLHTLTETGKPLNLNVIPVEDAAAAAAAIGILAATKKPEWGDAKSVAAWPHPLIEQLNLPEVLADQKIPVYFSGADASAQSLNLTEEDFARIRNQITASFMGVTSADFCLAETATLVLRTRPGQARAVSLVPSIHVAVIKLEQVLANLQELYAVLNKEIAEKSDDLTNCMTFISGPSKTADIELTMVHGAHGPRELHIIVIVGEG